MDSFKYLIYCRNFSVGDTCILTINAVVCDNIRSTSYSSIAVAKTGMKFTNSMFNIGNLVNEKCTFVGMYAADIPPPD